MNCKLTEETLGQRIKAQRVRMNMTQDKLAEISATDYSRS
jgi:transcriptional regulator with XRE-family HTH domain